MRTCRIVVNQLLRTRNHVDLRHRMRRWHDLSQNDVITLPQQCLSYAAIRIGIDAIASGGSATALMGLYSKVTRRSCIEIAWRVT
jgi:hypothetical protein